MNEKILLVNDDGINAPGIHALANALCDIYDVRVVAPANQQSGKSHAITTNEKIKVEKFDFGEKKIKAYKVYGTPADCTKLAFEVLYKDDLPDMVISGINNGENLGTDINYSGTIGAAKEGYLQGVFSIAVSLANDAEFSFEDAAMIFRHKLGELYKKGEKKLYNINFPKKLKDHTHSFCYTFQGIRRYIHEYELEQDWQKNTFYFMSGTPDDSGNEEGSDIYAFNNGYISITPLKVDYTDKTLLKNEEKI